MMQQGFPSGLRGLIDEMLNGTISVEGIKKLELALDENRGAQQFFRDYCQLHINLDAEMRAQRVVNSFADRDSRMMLTGSLADDVSLCSEVSEVLTTPARLARSGGSQNFARRHRLATACGIAAALMVAVGWAAYALMVERNSPVPRDPMIAQQPAVAQPAAGQQPVVAQQPVAGQQDAEANAAAAPIGAALADAESTDAVSTDAVPTAAVPTDAVVPAAGSQSELLARVQLDRGETRFIPLGDIGHVLLEGPADMEFINSMRARLNRGRIKLRITSPQGRGYVVETPHGEIKDLGTEFGIDASHESCNGVVVFEGAVDLSFPKAHGQNGALQIERLVQGEGLTFTRRGRLSRIMSIITGDNATFEQGGDMRLQRLDPIIANVTDNIQESDVRKFYEIVPCGLREDALTYVDRPNHEWNGIDKHGMPKYLIGADYVKTFNNDKMREDVEIQVTLCRPARLFVILDVRVAPPQWLIEEFRQTGDQLGLDIGPYLDPTSSRLVNCLRGAGSGNSIDERFAVWERVVNMPGVVKLGPNAGGTWACGMYAIAAVGLAEESPPASRTSTAPLSTRGSRSSRRAAAVDPAE